MEKKFLANAPALFDKEKVGVSADDSEKTIRIICPVGQLKVENDFLKKIEMMTVAERCQVKFVSWRTLYQHHLPADGKRLLCTHMPL